MPALETNHLCDRIPANQSLSMLFCHRVRPGGSPVPCRPQMDQEKVWPTQKRTIQCVGSLYSVEIGLHWKLNG